MGRGTGFRPDDGGTVGGNGADRGTAAGPRFGEQLLQQRAARRARLDLLWLMLAVGLALLVASGPLERLALPMATLGVGGIWYLMRRVRDIAALEQAGRWRDAALDGRGVSLADWHRGAPLPGRMAIPEPRDMA